MPCLIFIVSQEAFLPAVVIEEHLVVRSVPRTSSACTIDLLLSRVKTCDIRMFRTKLLHNCDGGCQRRWLEATLRHRMTRLSKFGTC